MESKNSKNSILIAEDDKVSLQALVQILREDYTIYTTINGKETLELTKKHSPDVILLDILMPDMDGLTIISELKRDETTNNIPVIFVTGLGEPADEEKGLALGAADYIIKPFNPPIVKLRVQNQIQILKQMETIRRLSTTDQLTGVSNRRNFDLRLDVEIEHAKRDKTPLSLIILDIDNFKMYNDTYGHLQGDLVLQTVANITEMSLRRSLDLLARWGGEEFVILLSDTDSAGAEAVAESIREKIEKASVPCHNGEKTKITVSVGVNTLIPTQDETSRELFNGADKALYEAKAAGKNRVCKFEKSA